MGASTKFLFSISAAALLIFFSLSFAAYPSGLIAYWSFDKNTSNLVSGVPATNNAALATIFGKVGGSYYFDGISGNYLNSTISYAMNSPFTYMAWVKKVGGPDNSVIFHTGQAADYSDGSMIYADTNANCNYRNPSDQLVGAGPLPLNQWMFVVCVFNGTHVLSYSNGSYVSALKVNVSSNSVTRVSFGKRLENIQYFNGTVDEVAVFNRVVNASDISQYYQNSLNGTCDYFGDCYSASIALSGSSIGNGGATLQNYIFANYSINRTYLNSFSLTFNNTTYPSPFMDYTTALYLNLDNVAAAGDNGATAGDLSGRGNSFSMNFALWNSSGKAGGSAYFNRNTAYLWSTKAIGNLTRGYTLMAWINPDTVNASYGQTILNPAREGQVVFWLCGTNGAALCLDHQISTGVYNVSRSTTLVQPGVWTHVAATWNGSSLLLYINGKPEPSPGTANVLVPVNYDATIGIRDYNKAANPFGGRIDEVRIWERALSASEIYLNYASSLNMIAANSWQFTTNQTNLSLGNYSLSFVSGASSPALSFSVASAPATSNFSGSSTNFSAVPDLANITSLTLEKPGVGKIQFPPTHSVNAAGQNYDSNVVMNNGMISVNSSALDQSFNSSATLTVDTSGVYSGATAPIIYYYPGFASNRSAIIQSGTACSAPRCTGITWNSSTNILTFNVTGFSSYGVNDSGMGGASNGTTNNNTATLGINITSTNQIAVYTSSSKNNSAFSFIPVTPPAAGSITLTSNESSNVTGGDTGFLVENQGNVNVSITVASDKNASGFIGGSTP
ncbi:MAG TPA: LamG domain-containing protein, partial [Candidatus Micrarchaeota archaeon]|nr:LamG domain-containing protein [Candidatus Micrarchaeota archaeon]